MELQDLVEAKMYPCGYSHNATFSSAYLWFYIFNPRKYCPGQWKDMPSIRVSPAWQRSQWDRRSWRGWSGRSRRKLSAWPAALTVALTWSGRRCSGWAEGIREAAASAENIEDDIDYLCHKQAFWSNKNRSVRLELFPFWGKKLSLQMYSDLTGLKMDVYGVYAQRNCYYGLELNC